MLIQVVPCVVASLVTWFNTGGCEAVLFSDFEKKTVITSDFEDGTAFLEAFEYAEVLLKCALSGFALLEVEWVFC